MILLACTGLFKTVFIQGLPWFAFRKNLKNLFLVTFKINNLWCYLLSLEKHLMLTLRYAPADRHTIPSSLESLFVQYVPQIFFRQCSSVYVYLILIFNAAAFFNHPLDWTFLPASSAAWDIASVLVHFLCCHAFLLFLRSDITQNNIVYTGKCVWSFWKKKKKFEKMMFTLMRAKHHFSPDES